MSTIQQEITRIKNAKANLRDAINKYVRGGGIIM